MGRGQAGIRIFPTGTRRASGVKISPTKFAQLSQGFEFSQAKEFESVGSATSVLRKPRSGRDTRARFRDSPRNRALETRFNQLRQQRQSEISNFAFQNFTKQQTSIRERSIRRATFNKGDRFTIDNIPDAVRKGFAPRAALNAVKSVRSLERRGGGKGLSVARNRARALAEGFSGAQFRQARLSDERNRSISQRISQGIINRSNLANLVLSNKKSPKSLTVSQEKLQGFQGDVSLVGQGKTSKFDIVGGKAVLKGASRTPIATSKTQITGDPEIDRIFAQQRGVTQLIASEFRQKRNIAISSGATIAEAQKFAEVTSKGLPKQEQEAINIVLQKDIIQTKAAQIDLAESLIKKQVTGEIPAGGLDDLAEQLKFAQPIPIKTIRVGLDAEGRDISPRKTKLQIENAILTGSTLKDLDFSIQVDKDLILSGKSPDDIFTFDELGNIIVDTNKFQSVLNPLAIKQITNPEDDIFSSILFDLTESKVQPELIDKARFEGQVLTLDETREIISEGQVLQSGEIIQGQLNKIAESESIEQGVSSIFDLLQSGSVDILTDPDTGIITLITKSGEEIFKGSPEEIVNFLDEQLQESGIENQQLLDIIASLREQLRGGDNINELLASLFSLLAELQRLGLQQGKEDELINISENPFDSFFAFLEQLQINFLNFITGITK